MDAEYAREVGIELTEEIDDLDEVQINAWVCGINLLRAVLIHLLLIEYHTMLFHMKEIHIIFWYWCSRKYG
jgi:hypothetical protein